MYFGSFMNDLDTVFIIPKHIFEGKTPQEINAPELWAKAISTGFCKGKLEIFPELECVYLTKTTSKVLTFCDQYDIYINFCSKFRYRGQKSPFSFERSRKERVMQNCKHKGEIPERDRIFSLSDQEFTWLLTGMDRDILLIECKVCGWRQLTYNIDRLGFFWDVESHLPEHP